jgi:predicted nucleic acid-binding protein
VLAHPGLELHASVELVQEVVFHRLRRRDRVQAVADARLVADSCQLHDFDSGVLRRALSLIAEGTVGGRDAVHAATALEAGIGVIVSNDADFDGIRGLTRIDPRRLDDALARTTDFSE